MPTHDAYARGYQEGRAVALSSPPEGTLRNEISVARHHASHRLDRSYGAYWLGVLRALRHHSHKPSSDAGANPASQEEVSDMTVDYPKSIGHIGWVPRSSGGWWEYWVREGSIWRADRSAPVMPDGYRSGRWYAYDREESRVTLGSFA